jgi:hypothetical protein
MTMLKQLQVMLGRLLVMVGCAATPRKTVTLSIAGSQVIINTWECKTLPGNTNHHRNSMQERGRVASSRSRLAHLEDYLSSQVGQRKKHNEVSTGPMSGGRGRASKYRAQIA